MANTASAPRPPALIRVLFGLTFVAGLVDAVIILTALAMGGRNATVRQLAVPDLTTTVLTLTLTGLAADSPWAGGTGRGARRRIIAVVIMFAGAAVGAWLVRWVAAAPLALGGIVATGCAIVAARLRTEEATPTPTPIHDPR